jgi:hypothetical protein
MCNKSTGTELNSGLSIVTMDTFVQRITHIYFFVIMIE